MIILNAISGLLFALFYFPPTFHMKFENRTKMQQLRDFDFIGTILFLAGFVLFLLGLSWGGGVYPWKSAKVISTMVVGGVVLIVFALYESFAKVKEPLLPIHLFKNFSWVVACCLLGLGARLGPPHPWLKALLTFLFGSIYYAMAIIWPEMVAVLYTSDGGASMYAGWLSCCPTLMINVGQIFGGFLAAPIGKTKWQCVSVLTIGGALLGGELAEWMFVRAESRVLTLVSSNRIMRRAHQIHGHRIDRRRLLFHWLERECLPLSFRYRAPRPAGDRNSRRRRGLNPLRHIDSF